MAENIPGVRTQNLRDFTVQIRRADTHAIVGTGITVSTDGKILTCAHVVEEAGIDPRNPNGDKVGVYFPQLRGGEEKTRTATVAQYFQTFDDDMVLLQLTDGASPLAPEQIAVLGTADASEGNPFRTYGYSSVGNFPASRGDGTILGSVEPPADRNLQVDPVQLKSRDIAPGMSGSAVLDTNRNLVVGLVAERYFPKPSKKEVIQREDIAYGVDSKVLTFAPFDFILRGESLGLRPAPELRLDGDLFAQAMDIARYALAHRKPDEKYLLTNALAVLPEWTGRDDLLAQLTEDWNDPKKHVTGLIGFGGEGKSSLARKWVEEMLKVENLKVEGSNLQPSNLQPSTIAQPSTPSGLFWWGFYENRSVDEFLEAALKYMSGGRIDPKAVPSSSLRAQIIGAMLGSGRYVFVLDGLEVMQHEDGDRYGLFTSNDLRDLLAYFARPDHESFCLVTSRAPLLDLMDYTTYTHRDVDRLSADDGRALLKRLGVQGSDRALDKIVADWDGHALTLSLLGSYLSEHFGGDLAHLADLPAPTADEPRYQRVHRVLRRYDEHLTPEEREFLKLFSAFRTPVHESAFEKVFVPLLGNFTTKGTKNTKEKPVTDQPINRSPITDQPTTDQPLTTLHSLISTLTHYRLLRHDPLTQTYTTHPLVRNHYLALLTHDTAEHVRTAPDTHLKIKDYYLSLAGDTPSYPTLDDLKPLIEVVHHACQAGAYDEAHEVRRDRIDQGTKFILLHQLGAFDTTLNLLYEFFPDGDTTKEPQCTSSSANRFIINHIGSCLMNLGRLREAVPFYERKNKIALEMEDWHNLSIGYRNLAELHAHLGALDESARAAGQALDLARRSENKQYEHASTSWQAHIANLRGELDISAKAFSLAEELIHTVTPGTSYNYSLPGISHADHLRRVGDPAYARRVTEANLDICERNHWPDDTSKSHRVLGDLDADAGDHASARTHYEAALKIARGISVRNVLIEALLARGRWAARYAKNLLGPRSAVAGDLSGWVSLDQAFNDLNEALGYCLEGGYRRYEADVRVGLAWGWLADGGLGDLTPGPSPQSGRGGALRKAREEAERALQMSLEIGYHWGQVDAREVLGEIERG